MKGDKKMERKETVLPILCTLRRPETGGGKSRLAVGGRTCRDIAAGEGGNPAGN